MPRQISVVARATAFNARSKARSQKHGAHQMPSMLRPDAGSATVNLTSTPPLTSTSTPRPFEHELRADRTLARRPSCRPSRPSPSSYHPADRAASKNTRDPVAGRDARDLRRGLIRELRLPPQRRRGTSTEARRRPSGTGRSSVARRAGASAAVPHAALVSSIRLAFETPQEGAQVLARAAPRLPGRRRRRWLPRPPLRPPAPGRRRTSLLNTRRGRPLEIGPPPPRRRGLLGDASTASCCAAARCVRHAADCQHLAAQELLKLVQSWHRNAAVQPPEAKISLKPKSAMQMVLSKAARPFFAARHRASGM